MVSDKNLVKVAVTGSAGQIGYILVYMLSKGEFFGPDVKVHLVMCDLPACKNILEGVKLELEDCCSPVLVKIDVCVEEEKAFEGVDYAILLAGALNLSGDMKRSDLLQANRDIYKRQGALFDKHAKSNARVLVVANPANTNATIFAEQLTRIPAENITCLTRLDANRAVGFVSRKLGVDHEQVENVTVLGNHSNSMVVHLEDATVKIDGKTHPIPQAINDQTWIKDELEPGVRGRATRVTQLRNRSSALSAAKAASDHIRDWHCGAGNRYVVMGVYVRGNTYGLPSNIHFGLPVKTYANKNYEIVSELKLSSDTKKAMLVSAEELLSEKKLAMEN